MRRDVKLWLPLSAELDSIPMLTAAVCMVLFSAIASIDGLYFHLYKYRLFERPASQREHRLHTINVVLFVPLVPLLFWIVPHGGYLWAALGLLACSLGVEVLDVLCEPDSRRDLGGLIGAEYLMHFLMAGLRFGATVPLLVCTSVADWSLAATAAGPRPLWFLLTGVYITVPAIGVALLHVLLLNRGPASRI